MNLASDACNMAFEMLHCSDIDIRIFEMIVTEGFWGPSSNAVSHHQAIVMLCLSTCLPATGWHLEIQGVHVQMMCSIFASQLKQRLESLPWVPYTSTSDRPGMYSTSSLYALDTLGTSSRTMGGPVECEHCVLFELCDPCELCRDSGHFGPLSTASSQYASLLL
jgi:hypothetical protein